jgi:hypothetical protein
MRNDRETALIQETRAVWQERYSFLLSEEDAQQIITNTTALFNVLDEWDKKSKLSA